ncbi:uncharacterized protein LOC131182214 [Hevea brasiliensis]|uniref:uncharacterized protein LOC131182214 n=1 Tax=Hevea brasiliensis TaxID=3981 RepID=UPI0025FAA064|nr:uncharacterized protein LOC131182214 [Hevea brasiliensis]
MAFDDEYQEEDSYPDGCESQWSYDSENKGYVKLLDKYDSQIKESDCFDFDPLPGLPKVFGLAYTVRLHRDDIFSNRCKEALKYAIEKENEKGANLIFEIIEHANMHLPG